MAGVSCLGSAAHDAASREEGVLRRGSAAHGRDVLGESIRSMKQLKQFLLQLADAKTPVRLEVQPGLSFATERETGLEPATLSLGS
jgi:hypothetical protein